MYEKYDALVVGQGGGGGEYVPQIGFGWSNAVALLLINATYTDSVPSSSDDSSTDNTLVIVLATILPLAFIAALVGAYVYYKKKTPTGRDEELGVSFSKNDKLSAQTQC